MLLAVIIPILFIALFSWLISTKKDIFSNKKRFLQIELGIILLATLIILVISGLGMTVAFLLLWVAVAFLCYYIYQNHHQKVGFIGVSFCTFFNLVFLYLQFWIYGTQY